MTHDQLEAMTLGDRIVVMNRGGVRQIDTPSTVYDHPNDTFVATFLGSPPMNLLAGSLERGGAGTIFRADAERSAAVPLPNASDPSVSRVLLGVRPEDLRVTRAERADGNDGNDGSSGSSLRATVQLVEALGHEQLVYLRVGDLALAARTARDDSLAPDTPVVLDFDPGRAHLFDEESGRALSAS
ncbi:MAG TPA: TOBE domain-containing protein [Candidatus Elarobacter sp.]|nr:TOBE domain-containing protein [Candidatus Elarobacter sp.]